MRAMQYDRLIEHIERYIKLTENEKLDITDAMHRVSIKQKQEVLSPGQRCTARYFVSEGCLHTYFINKKGEEQILLFSIENWWIADYESLTRGTPSEVYIQAIENSTLIRFDQKDEEYLFSRVPRLETYFRKVLETTYAVSVLRIKYLYQYSKEELFIHFKKAYPGFVERIPNYMMASYLGFTPEYLSKIRRKYIS